MPVPEQPVQQAPPVQRLRIRYAKRGRLRFTSHRDFSRAFERAVVRARLPMAYSSGFNPHPRISYANASPTGAASEAEYLEIGLARTLDPAEVHTALADAMPDGLDVVAVVESSGGSLADRLEASRWAIDVELAVDVIGTAVSAFMAEDSVEVERMTKKGLRAFDCRGAVVRLDLADAEQPAGEGLLAGRTRLDVVLRHTVPAVRPDDVLTGIGRAGGLEVGAPALVTRRAQGPLVDGEVGDPLAP